MQSQERGSFAWRRAEATAILHLMSTKIGTCSPAVVAAAPSRWTFIRRGTLRRSLALAVAAMVVVSACTNGTDGNDAAEQVPGAEERGGQVEQFLAGIEPAGPTPRPVPEELAEEQVLGIHAFFRPSTFDPAQFTSALARQYTEALLKPEADVTPPYGVQGAAAEGFEVSSDGLTYTFELRENGMYNDGQPVEAADFVYAWRRLIDPRVAAPFGSLFARVVDGGQEVASLGPETDPAAIEAGLDQLGLRALDGQTFEVRLSEPAPYFEWIATLTAGAPLRQEVVEADPEGWATTSQGLVTNGPLMVSEIGADATTLVPNPNYRDEVQLDRLVAYYTLDPAARWTKYLNDEIDISNGPPKASQAAVLQDPRFEDQILWYPELSNNWLEFNTRAAPFDNPMVRLAFAQAIDREAYLGVSTNLMVQPLTSLIPEGMPGYNPEVGAPQEFDPDQAKATLEASGVTIEEIGELEMLTFAVQERDAVFFKDQIEKNLGIPVTVTSLSDGAAISARVREGDYQLKTTFLGHAANYPDPQDFFDVFLSDSPDNETGWENSDYDRLVRQADSSLDPEERERFYDEAHAIVVEEAPVAFLAQPVRNYFVKPWVGGIKRTAIDATWMTGDFYIPNLAIGER